MKQFTSHIDFSLTKKRFKMMILEFSLVRAGSKSLLLLPLMALLVLSFCSKKADYSNPNHGELNYVPVLHLDDKRSEELGIPVTLGAHFTSSGELFSGVQKAYYSENDSLYMELYFKDGINTKSIYYMKDGDINRLIHGRYLRKTIPKKIYNNGVLAYQDIPPTESEDGMGHIRLWHKNGQLSLEVSYTGDKVRQGLLTEYDEKGNIIKQERYKDGELVETIK